MHRVVGPQNSPGQRALFVFANRAAAYFAQGDKQHALDDYNEAVKSAPRNADLYYNRGVFYVAQSDDDAALRDFDTAIGINSKLVRKLLRCGPNEATCPCVSKTTKVP